MNHGAAYLYVLEGQNPAAVARDLVPELAGLEGVAEVWTPDAYAGLGLPTPEENAHAGDLLLEAAPGFSFVDDADGEALLGPPKYLGTHGQLPTRDDNAAFFLAAGAGIRRGRELSAITSRDVAPTIAHLLGLAMPGVEGRVLTEVLD